MTIITKTTDKKKLLPIPTAPLAPPSSQSISSHDSEAAVAYARHRARTATLLVCLLGILVLLTGVLAGVCFYRQYLRDKVQRLNLYMPYEQQDLNSNDNVLLNSRFRDGPTYAESFKTHDSDSDDDDDDFRSLQNFFRQIMAQLNRDMEDPMREIRRMESIFPQLDDNAIRNKYFREEFEIKDDESDSYADIKIPEFRDGRRGRFIHDFKNNQTTIIDEDKKRCFIYPLDYSTTLPPKSMFDVILKMQTGYYYPDTNVLRKKMRVVTPELDHDDEYISNKIKLVCNKMHIYKLEAFVSGVFKRSITPDTDAGKFAEFAGKNLLEVDLINVNDLDALESA